MYTTCILESSVSIRRYLERRLEELPGLTRRPSRSGGSRSYFLAGREVAHFHGDQRMDLRLTKERVPKLKSAGLLDSRVTIRGQYAEWVAVALTDPRDVEYALQLLEELIRASY